MKYINKMLNHARRTADAIELVIWAGHDKYLAKKISIFIFTLVQLIAAPTLCYSQYFQRLCDFNSSQDCGWSIFLKSDGSYFISGSSVYPGPLALNNINLSPDGNIELNRHTLLFNKTDI